MYQHIGSDIMTSRLKPGDYFIIVKIDESAGYECGEIDMRKMIGKYGKIGGYAPSSTGYYCELLDIGINDDRIIVYDNEIKKVELKDVTHLVI